ncbi:DoxX family membrane protein [Streptomyces flavalbus]|uniref:DoxX family membrane protein n=1 Tax=Streptomyces flavalbus TaxID=2665155 RepID=A0ABW2WL45_9ACTN
MRIYGQVVRFLEGLGAAIGVTALRTAIGIIFLWFGVPKLFPGVSPAEPLAADTVEKLTFGLIEGTTASVLTGALETVIGLLLVSGKLRPLTVIVLLGHMAGTFTPLFLFPKETWESLCIGTLEGQYILKNLVIVAGALVIIGHSGGRGQGAPPAPPPRTEVLAEEGRPPAAAGPAPVTAPDRAG